MNIEHARQIAISAANHLYLSGGVRIIDVSHWLEMDEAAETSDEFSYFSYVTALTIHYTLNAGNFYSFRAWNENGNLANVLRVDKFNANVYSHAGTVDDQTRWELVYTGEPYTTPAQATPTQTPLLPLDIASGETLSAGAFLFGIRQNGTVVITPDVTLEAHAVVHEWRDILSISATGAMVVGLKSDGTVVTNLVEADTSAWYDIVAVAMGGRGSPHIAGLKSDGTVVFAGENLAGHAHTHNWSNIVAISASMGNTAALRSDGTVVLAGSRQEDVWNDVSEWRDIVAVSEGVVNVIGLQSNGRVVAAGTFSPIGGFDRTDIIMDTINGWTDIIAIEATMSGVVGLRSDGTVVVASPNIRHDNYLSIKEWRDIVAITTGSVFIAGLRSDGTVVAVYDRAIDVPDWSDWVLMTK